FSGEDADPDPPIKSEVCHVDSFWVGCLARQDVLAFQLQTDKKYLYDTGEEVLSEQVSAGDAIVIPHTHARFTTAEGIEGTALLPVQFLLPGGATLRVVGVRPFAIAAREDSTVAGLVDVSSKGLGAQDPGAGAGAGCTQGEAGASGTSNINGGAGGGGGAL